MLELKPTQVHLTVIFTQPPLIRYNFHSKTASAEATVFPPPKQSFISLCVTIYIFSSHLPGAKISKSKQHCSSVPWNTPDSPDSVFSPTFLKTGKKTPNSISWSPLLPSLLLLVFKHIPPSREAGRVMETLNLNIYPTYSQLFHLISKWPWKCSCKWMMNREKKS